ncbi:hypothetical protein AFCA_003093 [Aspergillus flavus]|nr:hypothetical protein AFCA_003093 [Aspergillus flavus]
MNVFVTLLLVALMGCPLVKAMPINGGMAHQFQPSLSAHAGLAVGLSMGIPLLAGMANDIWLYNKIMKHPTHPSKIVIEPHQGLPEGMSLAEWQSLIKNSHKSSTSFET